VPAFDTTPAFKSLGYAGGLRDPDTRLVRFGARDYDPEIGRWTTKDPLLTRDNLNSFAYAEGSPVNLRDPNGFLASSQECEAILNHIKNLEADIAKRTGEVAENPRSLPWSCPLDRDKPSTSVRGHIRILNLRKAQLAYYKALYLAKCGGRPPGGYPGPGESFFDEKYWERVTGLTGSALVAYLIASELSRLYPPRNLLPVP
jgi:RHS repeat-associated protein